MTDSRKMVKRVMTRRQAGSSVEQSAALMRWLSLTARKLGSAGKHVYVVGGAVRNFVLNQPIKDVDMVVDSLATGGKDASWVAEAIARRIPAMTKVWTDNLMVSHIQVKGSWVLDGHEMEDEEIEIVNARKEVYETDADGEYVGHKPIEVSPTTLEDDVTRREFTFNTLMWRLIDLAEGPDKAEIIDLTGCGLRDLDNKVMACPRPPDQTFKEDPTRILRIIKFAFKYGFKLTKDTEAAARRQAKGLRRIPSKTETVLKKVVLDSPHYKKALGVMDDLGVLDVIKVMMRENPKTFGSFMSNNAKTKGFAYMFDLMDVGLPVGQDISFLEGREQKRFREVVLSMSQKDAEAFRDGLKNPGNVYKDKRFFVDLAKEMGLEKKNMGVLGKKLNELGREALLRDPSLMQNPHALKDHLRRAVTSSRKNASLLPVMSPWFNVREVIKQCILLEDHLFHPHKRCPDCIAKHFLTIEGFLEEATTLDTEGALDFDSSLMADRIRLLQRAWVDGADERWIAQAIRGLRKGFHPVELLGVRVARVENIVDRQIPCPHAIMKTAGFKRWLAGLLAKATAVKAVYDWGTEEVEGVATPLGSLQPKGFIWQIGSQWFGTSNFVNHIRFRSEHSAIQAVRFDKVATKTHGENEDEQTNKLIKKTPKKKPPRKDLRKERVDVQADPDIENLGAEGDDDLSLNYKRIAARWLFANVEKTDGGKWRATKSNKTEYFHSEQEAQAWLEDKDPNADDEPEDGEAPPAEEEAAEGAGDGQAQRVEINGPDDIPEELQGLLDIEAFNDGEGKPLKGLYISGPAEGRYTISVEHADGSSEEVSVDPTNEDDLDHLITFPEEVAKNSEVKTKALMTKQRDTRKKLHKRMEKLLPELAEKLPSENFIDGPDFDHAAFDAAYDNEMAVIKSNPMPIGEARVSLNGEAAAEMFDADEDTPVAELIGQIMARAEYAKKTHFSPSKDLTKPKVKGDLSKDERFAQVSATMEDSKRHAWSDREVLVLALQAERETLSDDTKRAKEIDARIEGHQLAAILKDHKFPGGDEPANGVKTFVKKLAESEDGRAVLCTPNEEWGTKESREAMKSAMEEVPDEQFHELFEEGTAAALVADLVKNGRDPEERKTFRDMATEVHFDSMTVYEPLLAMRDAPLSDKERADYQKDCAGYVDEAKTKLEAADEQPSGILDWLRQMLSSLVSALFGEKDSKEDTPPEQVLLRDKVKEHADSGDASPLSHKTRPAPPALFGGSEKKEK